MITLRSYLSDNKMTLRAFSMISNIDQSQLSRYNNRLSIPSLENAYKIYRASKKAVKMEGWLHDSIKSKRYN
jgi:transcriptional regulator with XRE-family HTH domain